MAGTSQDGDALAALQAHFNSSFDAAPIKPVAERRSKGKQPKKEGRVNGETGSRKVKETKDKDFELEVPKSAPVKKAKASVQAPSKPAPETVVFGEPSASTSRPAQGGWRKFMSAKVATQKDKYEEEEKARRLAKEKAKLARQAKKDGVEDDAEEEKQLTTNDRALSELLSSTIFAPDAQPAKKANGKPNLSSNATLSRILELSQPTLTQKPKSVGRGLGASLAKADELGRMPSTMRHGMRKAERQREAAHVDEAKELGLYHQSLKHMLGRGGKDGADLVQGTRDRDRKARTRQKGLSMGVGRFTGGTLRLSKDEVHRINDSGKRKAADGKKRKRQ